MQKLSKGHSCGRHSPINMYTVSAPPPPPFSSLLQLYQCHKGNRPTDKAKTGQTCTCVSEKSHISSMYIHVCKVDQRPQSCVNYIVTERTIGHLQLTK